MTSLPPPPGSILPPPPPPLPAAPPDRRSGGLWIGIALFVVAAFFVSSVGYAAFSSREAGSLPEGPHSFLEQDRDGTPYRWNPCQPIHFVVNPDHEPAGADDDLHAAIARVASATGIRFVDDGTVVDTADQQIGSDFQSGMPGPRYLPLLVTFVTDLEFHFLVDSKRAVGFGMPARGDGDLAHEFVSGVVVVDIGQELARGFGTRYSMGPVLMHELGHVMGLGHVGAADELMWSPQVAGHQPLNLAQTDWGPGDLEGLRLLGHDAGCLPAR